MDPLRRHSPSTSTLHLEVVIVACAVLVGGGHDSKEAHLTPWSPPAIAHNPACHIIVSAFFFKTFQKERVHSMHVQQYTPFTTIRSQRLFVSDRSTHDFAAERCMALICQPFIVREPEIQYRTVQRLCHARNIRKYLEIGTCFIYFKAR